MKSGYMGIIPTLQRYLHQFLENILEALAKQHLLLFLEKNETKPVSHILMKYMHYLAAFKKPTED